MLEYWIYDELKSYFVIEDIDEFCHQKDKHSHHIQHFSVSNPNKFTIAWIICQTQNVKRVTFEGGIAVDKVFVDMLVFVDMEHCCQPI